MAASAPPPGAPGLDGEPGQFGGIRRLRNHWARPAGPRSYYWYLTFEGSPALHALARKCADAIDFPYYDLTGAQGLHMTLERIAFERDIPAGRLEDVTAAAVSACRAIPPFDLTFSLLGGVPGAVGFVPSLAGPARELRGALREATLSAYPDAAVKAESAFHPHVTVAYANADDIPAADAIAAVEKWNAAPARADVTVSEACLVLLERQPRAYAWQTISRVPLAGARMSPFPPA